MAKEVSLGGSELQLHESRASSTDPISSIAKLIEAAITARATNKSLLDVGQEMAREQEETSNAEAYLAPLPPFDVGKQLVKS